MLALALLFANGSMSISSAAWPNLQVRVRFERSRGRCSQRSDRLSQSSSAICIVSFRNPPMTEHPWKHLSATIFYISSIACDLLIAGSQAHLFHKSRTGIGRSAVSSPS
ncbi:hypothetical protein L210DRAFT_2142170 [Boletus edulis BED1]|uniref:Secreted protein n=1 Tax=Boletus edulis BED1 TaxID=1328754 RepID=A0AAD4G6V0_BOLED|nr:hypothetical protein L210DRAFT_638610 [Boletus edulis BED1]KAF8423467.1 hypothetical protein L210DRAFT_2142170 [Boletus edulis BED1]